MENTAMSMEQIQRILAGSQRLNEMKQEIEALMGMTLGFLTQEEKSRFRYGEALCEFATPGLNWKITRWKRECIGVEAYDAENPRAGFVYSYTWGGSSRIGMWYIQLVHQALPEVMTNLVKVFPSLAGRFALLLQAASK
jgi:hypothetical protein